MCPAFALFQKLGTCCAQVPVPLHVFYEIVKAFVLIFRLALKEQKRKELYAKQGRGSQFTSKEERDQWIQRELKQLRKQIKDKEEHRDKLAADLEKDARRSVELEKEIEARTRDMEQLRVEIDRHNKDFYEIKKKKDQLQVKRG